MKKSLANNNILLFMYNCIFFLQYHSHYWYIIFIIKKYLKKNIITYNLYILCFHNNSHPILVNIRMHLN